MHHSPLLLSYLICFLLASISILLPLISSLFGWIRRGLKSFASMGEQKVVVMILKVDLQCSRCYNKVKKLLCKFPQIRDQVFNEKANTVTIRVRCCDPEKIRDKLCCKGGGAIMSIEIKEPGGEKKKPVVVEDNPKAPEPKPDGDKPEPSPADKPHQGKGPAAAKPEKEVVVIVPIPAPPAPEPAAPELKVVDPSPRPPEPEPGAVEPPSWPPCYDYGRPVCYCGYGGMCRCCCAYRCEYIVVEESSVCTIM